MMAFILSFIVGHEELEAINNSCQIFFCQAILLAISIMVVCPAPMRNYKSGLINTVI
jgi:hypothetical protein